MDLFLSRASRSGSLLRRRLRSFRLYYSIRGYDSLACGMGATRQRQIDKR